MPWQYDDVRHPPQVLTVLSALELKRAWQRPDEARQM